MLGTAVLSSGVNLDTLIEMLNFNYAISLLMGTVHSSAPASQCTEPGVALIASHSARQAASFAPPVYRIFCHLGLATIRPTGLVLP
jgi:hypothetical protein